MNHKSLPALFAALILISLGLSQIAEKFFGYKIALTPLIWSLLGGLFLVYLGVMIALKQFSKKD